jgi:hypothetical protein
MAFEKVLPTLSFDYSHIHKQSQTDVLNKLSQLRHHYHRERHHAIHHWPRGAALERQGKYKPQSLIVPCQTDIMTAFILTGATQEATPSGTST